MADPGPVVAARPSPQQPELVGVDTDTGPMWAIALLPLSGIPVGLIPSVFNGQPSDPSPTGTALNLGTAVLDLVILAVSVLLAVHDRRILRQSGIHRPMHPAWELLDPVYVIGRAVVVRRRVRGSLRPLWVWVATSVVAAVVPLIAR